MILLIDADSLVYVIAWNYRDIDRDPQATTEVWRSCDNMLRDLMTLTEATHYIGAFSARPCFRQEIYKYATYKGNRGEKPEWIQRWEPVITEYYRTRHEFQSVPGLEADDIVAALAHLIPESIICSPDKDLRQVPGRLYIPGKGAEIEGRFLEISPVQADYTFWLQMLCGDSTDNVAGVPGLGEVKGGKLLAEAMDPMMYPSIVKGAYQKYFGPNYGSLIYEETLHTLQMLCPQHLLWGTYQPLIASLVSKKRPMPLRAEVESLFD